MKTIKAKPISYDYTRKRNRKSVDYIVLHYTGNKGDTAYGNCRYFQTGNTRQAGAHFFVDQQGNIYKSIPMNRTAWSVGGYFTKANGAGKYYLKCTNYNSVSIEMCDCATKDPSPAMRKAIKKLIKYIQKYCPNAKTLCRHWDVNGKSCPSRLTGTNNERWNKLLEDIGYRKTPKKTETKTDTKKGTGKKSNKEIAKEVIAGKWGNGTDRKKRLESAGYNYSTIQKLVNDILKG